MEYHDPPTQEIEYYKQCIAELLPNAVHSIFQRMVNAIDDAPPQHYDIKIIPPEEKQKSDEDNKLNDGTPPRSSISSDYHLPMALDPVIQLKVNTNKLTASIPRNSIGPLKAAVAKIDAELMSNTILEEKENLTDRRSIENTDAEIVKVVKSQPNDITFIMKYKKVFTKCYAQKRSNASSNNLNKSFVVKEIHNDMNRSLATIRKGSFDPPNTDVEKSDIMGFVLEDMVSIGGDKFMIPKNIIVCVNKINSAMGTATCTFKGKIGIFYLKALKILLV